MKSAKVWNWRKMQRHNWYLMSLKAKRQVWWTSCSKRMTLFMYLKTMQTYLYLLIFRLIRVSNAIFLANIKIGTETKVLEQLNRGVDAHDVKEDNRLSTIRSLHAKWIVDMLKFMKESKYLQKISKRSQNLQLWLIFVRIQFSKLNW